VLTNLDKMIGGIEERPAAAAGVGAADAG
jgi:hypothetical protein